MNPKTLKALDQIVARMERRANRPARRFPTSPLVMGVGLAMGVLLLTRLVPMAWGTLLPGGLDQAATLFGWPGLIWRLAAVCHRNEPALYLLIVVFTLVSLVACLAIRPLRVLAWVAALSVILVDAAILVLTIQTSLRATAAEAGLDLGLG